MFHHPQKQHKGGINKGYNKHAHTTQRQKDTNRGFYSAASPWEGFEQM